MIVPSLWKALQIFRHWYWVSLAFVTIESEMFRRNFTKWHLSNAVKIRTWLGNASSGLSLSSMIEEQLRYFIVRLKILKVKRWKRSWPSKLQIFLPSNLTDDSCWIFIITDNEWRFKHCVWSSFHFCYSDVYLLGANMPSCSRR